MKAWFGSLGRRLVYGLKMTVARISLLAVGVAFELAARFSKQVQEEIAGWTDNLVFSMGVLPNGPFMTVKKVGRDRVRYLGSRLENPDLAILFKNIDCALMVFTGQIGTPTAAAEKRFICRGNISESMRVSRTLAIVQTYLFPAFVIRMTFRRPPAGGLKHLWTKTLINLGLVPGLALKAFK